MTTRDHRERRGTVLVDREFQLRFISRLAGILCFYLLLFLVVSVVAPVAFTLMGEPPEWAMMETAFRIEVLLRIILAPLICTFLCLFAHGILETFRVAGPNYRFKAVFKDLQQLRVPRGVRIRQNDYLADTAEQLDKGLISLHDHVQQMKVMSRDAVQAVRSGQGSIEAVERLDSMLSAMTLLTCAPACQPIDEQEAVEPMEPTSDSETREPQAAEV